MRTRRRQQSGTGGDQSYFSRDDRERLTLVEADLEDQGHAIREMGAMVRALNDKLDAITNQLATVGRPDWRTLLAGFGGVFGIVSTMVGGAFSVGSLLVVLYTTPLKQDIATARQAVNANTQALHQHEALPGHAGTLKQYAQIAERLRNAERADEESQTERALQLLERLTNAEEGLLRKRADRK